MKDIIEKLSSYNVFNYLLPGTLFAGLGEKLTEFSLIQENLIIAVFLYYFIGLIISRIGSLIVEPVLKHIKLIKFADYKDYVEASKSDSKIELLSGQNNMYRGLCSLLIMLICLKIYEETMYALPWSDNTSHLILLAGILVLFLLSYWKQTKYIVQRIKMTQKEE